MALLAEYAITPAVFDSASFSSEEVCGLHLQTLKDVLLNEGLVRDLRRGEWAKAFNDTSRPWHKRTKELLRKLHTQRRIVFSDTARTTEPRADSDWCLEALESHAWMPLAGVISTETTAAPHAKNPIVSAVDRLANAQWWANRSPSLLIGRTLEDYRIALASVLRHANSLMFIDPFIDPSNRGQYGDLMTILTGLQARSVKPSIEIHRAAWYGGKRGKTPQLDSLEAQLHPELLKVARSAGLSMEVFLWDEIHDRYLITDLIGISLPYGFGTTTRPDAKTTWNRLGRGARDGVQREFDPAHRRPLRRFTVG